MQLRLTNNQLLAKGLFAIAAVAFAATVGAVSFVRAATNDNSGYGTSSEQAIAAADTFADAVNDDQTDFSGDIADMSSTAKAQLVAGGNLVDDFDGEYADATSDFNGDLNTAFDQFKASVLAAGSTAESKNQFIDQFNHAKADYLNALDAAKNKFADKISKLGGNANVVKDQFMNDFNSKRDAFSNQLEQSKNDFAATLG